MKTIGYVRPLIQKTKHGQKKQIMTLPQKIERLKPVKKKALYP